MGLLRRAAAVGYKGAGAMAREVALDSLRTRADFRLLLPLPQTELDANKNLTQNQGY